MTEHPFTVKELQQRGARWRKAVQAHEAARVALNEAVVEAANDGMSQSEIARALRWPRQRVHDLVQRSLPGVR